MKSCDIRSCYLSPVIVISLFIYCHYCYSSAVIFDVIAVYLLLLLLHYLSTVFVIVIHPQILEVVIALYLLLLLFLLHYLSADIVIIIHAVIIVIHAVVIVIHSVIYCYCCCCWCTVIFAVVIAFYLLFCHYLSTVMVAKIACNLHQIQYNSLFAVESTPLYP